MEIENLYYVNDMLATSGQPAAFDFATIQRAGYVAIVNLALPTSAQAIPEEGSIVTNLGMTYVHIPVDWENPRLDDVQLFFQAMQAFAGRPIWVHCVVNKRVSCFIYLYQKYILSMGEEEARNPMTKIWEPDGAWRRLVDNVAAMYVAEERQP